MSFSLAVRARILRQLLAKPALTGEEHLLVIVLSPSPSKKHEGPSQLGEGVNVARCRRSGAAWGATVTVASRP